MIAINKKENLVVVNATALSSGGALTILKQFLLNAHNDRLHRYLCFVPESITLPIYENITYIKVRKQGGVKRVYWDLYGLARYLRKNNLFPTKVISLQNTHIRTSFPQIIYVHQPIPFSNIPLKLSVKYLKFWMYKYIYPLFIFLNPKDVVFVVQTLWMKNAILNKRKIIDKNNVYIIKPTIDRPIFPENFRMVDSNEVTIIFPATCVFYKNHKVILDAMNILKSSEGIGKLKFQVTFNINDYPEFYELVNKYELDDYVEFLGVLEYKDLYAKYNLADAVVFPSYLESFGLPLAEAAMLGKYIICSDLPYSRDVLSGYGNVCYVKFDDAEAWSEILKSIILNRDRCRSEQFDFEQSTSWKDFFKLI